MNKLTTFSEKNPRLFDAEVVAQIVADGRAGLFRTAEYYRTRPTRSAKQSHTRAARNWALAWEQLDRDGVESPWGEVVILIQTDRFPMPTASTTVRRHTLEGVL